MKRIVFFILFSLFSFLIWSCDDDEDGKAAEIAPVSDITYESGYGEIYFKWENPDYQDISHVEISYEDSVGYERRILVPGGVSEQLVEGFGSSQIYDFTFTVYGKNGVSSLPVKISVSAQPNEPYLNLFNAKIKIARKNRGVSVSWYNKYDGEYYINVSYSDINNNEHTKEIVVTDPGEGEEFMALEGVMEATLYITTSDIYGNKTTPRVYSYKVAESGKLDRSIWTVSASSHEVTMETCPVSNVVDGNTETFWHSEWGSGTNTFPHYISVDLRRKVSINRIGLQHRHNKTMANGIEFYGTNRQNGVYEKFGEFAMDQNTKTMQYYTLSTPVEYRYVRILFTTPSSGDSKNAGLAELEIWGDDIDE